MPLVSIEGFDGMGKSTVISQLMNKYPLQLYTTPFPSDPRLYDYSHDIQSLDGLFEYHTRFLYDFIKRQDDIQKQLDNGKTVLLDRYFHSNFAYMMYDFKMWMKVNNIDTKTASKYIRELKFIIYPFYKELIQPDLTIFLQDHVYAKWNSLTVKPIKDLKYRVNQCYESMMADYNSDRYSYFYVIALQPSTLPSVENILIEQGYIQKEPMRAKIK